MIDFIHGMVSVHPYYTMIASCLLAIATDIVWVKWNVAVNKGERLYAANWSLFIYLTSCLYTLIIIEKDIRQIFAYIVGAWLGTYLTVKQEKN